MKTIETKVYSFDELNTEAKQTVIEGMREKSYQNNDFASWAIDDCALLEPPHKELEKLFKDKYNFPLIQNNRNVYFDTDRNRHIDISKAMEIQNSTQFLKWLGLNDRLIDKVDYDIQADTIIFDNNSHLFFTTIEEAKIEAAIEKFEDHCENILKAIENDIEYRFTDEAIIEDINGNDYEFTEDGKQFNF